LFAGSDRIQTVLKSMCGANPAIVTSAGVQVVITLSNPAAFNFLAWLSVINPRVAHNGNSDSALMADIASHNFFNFVFIGPGAAGGNAKTVGIDIFRHSGIG